MNAKNKLSAIRSVKNETKFAIEAPKPFSKSMIWDLQRKFFEQKCPQAWRQNVVPHYITNNPYIGHAYSKVVQGFINDHMAIDSKKKHTAQPTINPNYPLYIVEIGAGSGCFAYHFLKNFFKQQGLSSKNGIKAQYVITDFTKPNLDFCNHHPALQTFTEKGLLDFALFDIENEGPIQLLHAKTEISTKTLKNPLVVIANYVFNSVKMDVFEMKDKQLYQGLVTATSSQPDARLDDINLIKLLELSYTLAPCSTDYYTQPAWNKILKNYTRQLNNTAVLFPTTGLQCLDRLHKLTKGHFLLLTGDKGLVHASALKNRKKPHLVKHGSFSMPVNYHAMKVHMRNLGGLVLHTDVYTHLNIMAFVIGAAPNDFFQTRKAYQEVIYDFGPDDFFTTKKDLQQHLHQLNNQQLLRLLKLSRWDANVIKISYPVLRHTLASASETIQEAFTTGLEKVWSTYYPMQEKFNLPLHIARLLMVL